MNVRDHFMAATVAAALACGLACPAGHCCAGAAAPAGSASPKPARGPFDDNWLSEALGEELKQFSATGEYAPFAERVKKAILARLACGHPERLSALCDMIYVLRACAYLPMAEEVSGGKDLPKWLLEHRAVSRRLFRAMEDVTKPREALTALQELLAAEDSVLAYPELAVAFATSLPLGHYRPQPAPCSRLEGFRYYTDAKLSFGYDLKKMPFEISRYLADTRLNLKERAWAVTTCRKVSNPAKHYFSVKYDYAHYRKAVPKKIANLPYTLPNLKRVGGVCIEQAYYAAEVCKAMGVPATIVTGRGKSGIGHAWVACLKIGGKRAYWDSQTGRYAAHKYYTGELRDPSTGRKILDNELMLIGAAAQLPLARREEADAALTLARLVERVRDDKPPVDLEVLKALAARFDQRVAGQKGRPKACVDWIQQVRQIDLSLVEDLVDASVDRNLAYKPAWQLIIEMRKNGRLPVDHLGRFFDTLVRRTAKEFPDYSCSIVMRIVPTIADPGRRESVYQKALAVYKSRPDLAGDILIALGDDYRAQEKKAKALRAYETAAMRCVDIPEVVLTASARAEGLLIGADRRDRAIKMYKKLFAKAKKSSGTAFRNQTAHYKLGMRLAQLLRDDGQDQAAERIQRRL